MRDRHRGKKRPSWRDRLAQQSPEKKKANDKARGQLRPPTITKELAMDVAKMLMAGIPVDQALAYVDPDFPKLKDSQRERCMSAWLNSPLLFEANTALMGGDWQSMEKDRRLQLALDKHLAELAYLLYSKNYIESSGDISRKMDSARNALTDWLKDTDGTAETPWIKALKEIVDGKINGQAVAAGAVVNLPLTLEKH